MQSSQKFLKDNNILEKLSFKDPKTRKVTVTLINDKEQAISTPTGPKPGIKYLVEHEGQNKVIITGSVSLIQKLAKIEPGSEVTIEMFNSGGKNYFRVNESDEDIPVVEEDEYEGQSEFHE